MGHHASSRSPWPPSRSHEADWWIVGWCGVVLAYTVIRTPSPIRYLGNVRSLLEVVCEVALLVAAVASTGLLGLAVHLLAADRDRPSPASPAGSASRLRIGIASALAVSIPFVLDPTIAGAEIRITVQWTVVLLLVAVIAGYARRISGEADRQHSLALDRLAAWPTPTRCCSRCTGSPSRCRPRST